MVVVIAGIIVGISVSKLNTTMTQQRIIRGANSIASQMRYAFTLAQRNRKPVRLYFHKDSLLFSVMNRAQTQVYERVVLGTKSGTHIEGLGLTTSQFSFYPTTGIVEVYPTGYASDSMSITISAPSGTTGVDSKRVRMTRAGLVQVK